MSLAANLTVIIITFNEEDNIARTLAALSWASNILVIDSGSTDQTLDLLNRDGRVCVIRRAFDTFAGQCNFALDHVRTKWVLSLDADYELSNALGDEICALANNAAIAGFAARFVYRVYGRPLRSSLYPPRCILYQRDRAHYVDEGHGHRVEIEGKVEMLRHVIYHDDRKPLSRWLSAQIRYARAEATLLLSTDRAKLKLIDRLRLYGLPAPPVVLLYVLFVRGCVFDGRSGWFYALQRFAFEIVLMLELLDRRLSQSKPQTGN